MTTLSSLSKQNWPREWVAGELDNFFGDPRGYGGRADPAWAQRNLTTIVPPWAMRIDGRPVSNITIHRRCTESLTRILNAIWDFTGRDPEKIKAAHLDEFSGSYNFRMNVNAPSKLSLHAYGAAIDLAAAENPNGAPWRENGRMLPRWAIDAFLAEGWCWGGDFSGTPDAMHFQATFNRHADAPQNQQQPSSISSASAQLTANTKFTVTGTMFGGPGDDQAVAYGDVATGWPNRPGVALPFRFSGPRPKVIVSANGETVTCQIVDVGPWNTNDPYWMTGTRPQAESGTDMSGRRTNHAGIDLTPAAAAAIGLIGKSQVAWFFDSTAAEPMIGDAATIAAIEQKLTLQPANVQAPGDLIVAIKQLLDQMQKGGAVQIPTRPVPSNDLASTLQQVANLLQKLNINIPPTSTAPVSMLPPQGQAAQLQKILDFVSGLINPSGKSAPLGQVNGALGEAIGNLLNGKKTALGVIGSLLTAWLANVPALPAGGTPSGVLGLLQLIAGSVPGLSGFTMPLFLALTAWGALGKFEKWAQNTAPPPTSTK
jgi:D-alanyl-D-alanine carboxypeptidase